MLYIRQTTENSLVVAKGEVREVSWGLGISRCKLSKMDNNKVLPGTMNNICDKSKEYEKYIKLYVIYTYTILVTL